MNRPCFTPFIAISALATFVHLRPLWTAPASKLSHGFTLRRTDVPVLINDYTSITAFNLRISGIYGSIADDSGAISAAHLKITFSET
jgi:hypothetical protein